MKKKGFSSGSYINVTGNHKKISSLLSTNWWNQRQEKSVFKTL
jgi:hypothetical protein